MCVNIRGQSLLIGEEQWQEPLTASSLCILTVPDKAREVFQTALEFFGDEEEQVEKAQAVFGAFARMETRLKEFERARVIYKFALARLPRSKSANRTSHHCLSLMGLARLIPSVCAIYQIRETAYVSCYLYH